MTNLADYLVTKRVEVMESLNCGSAVANEVVGELERRAGHLPSLYHFLESILESKNPNVRSLAYASLGWVKDLEGADLDKLRGYAYGGISKMDLPCRIAIFKAYNELNDATRLRHQRITQP